MNKSQYIVALIAIGVITATTAITHAYLEAGWQSQSQIKALAARLQELPDSFGDWQRTSRKEIPSRILQVLRCYGYISDSYENTQTGSVISVAVLFGPRGPIAVHTPEICYSSVGTQSVGSRRTDSIESGNTTDVFWSTRFTKQGIQEPILEVWYGWSDGGAWHASENPRYWMTDFLYKLQISGQLQRGDGTSDCRSFLHSFLPVLRKHLGSREALPTI